MKLTRRRSRRVRRWKIPRPGWAASCTGDTTQSGGQQCHLFRYTGDTTQDGGNCKTPDFPQTSLLKNKPAAQAAVADPSQCNSTNRQNPLIQQNFHNFGTSNAIWMPFKIYNLLKHSNIISWLKASSSTIRAWWRREDIFTNHQLSNNDQSVCRAAPGFARVC